MLNTRGGGGGVRAECRLICVYLFSTPVAHMVYAHRRLLQILNDGRQHHPNSRPSWYSPFVSLVLLFLQLKVVCIEWYFKEHCLPYKNFVRFSQSEVVLFSKDSKHKTKAWRTRLRTLLKMVGEYVPRFVL